MSHRENGSDSNLWMPSFHPPAVNDSEWWGWSMLDILADLPEILIQYLFIKLRRRVLELRQLRAKQRSSDERWRNRQRD
jgi:hypothetical protein